MSQFSATSARTSRRATACQLLSDMQLALAVAFLVILVGCSNALKFEPFGFMVKQKPNKISSVIQKLESTNCGLITSANEEIISSIKDLRGSPFVEKRDGPLVEGFWELLWTTEKVEITNAVVLPTS